MICDGSTRSPLIRHLETLLSEAGHKTKLYIGRTAPGSPAPTTSSLQEVIDALAARRVTGVVSAGRRRHHR